jgi:hypothetical protein
MSEFSQLVDDFIDEKTRPKLFPDGELVDSKQNLIFEYFRSSKCPGIHLGYLRDILNIHRTSFFVGCLIFSLLLLGHLLPIVIFRANFHLNVFFMSCLLTLPCLLIID